MLSAIARTFANCRGLMRPLSGTACTMLMLCCSKLSRRLNGSIGGRRAVFNILVSLDRVSVKFSVVVVMEIPVIQECGIGFQEMYSLAEFISNFQWCYLIYEF